MNPLLVSLYQWTPLVMLNPDPFVEVEFEPAIRKKPAGRVMFTDVMFRLELVLFMVMLNIVLEEPASIDVLGVTVASKPDTENNARRKAELMRMLRADKDLICMLYII